MKLTWMPMVNLKSEPLGPIRGFCERALIAEITKNKESKTARYMAQFIPGKSFLFGNSLKETQDHIEGLWSKWVESAGLIYPEK